MLRCLFLSFSFAAIALASCPSHHTCCAEFDFFIPIGQTCVEDEPSGKNNCARNGQGKVPFLAGVCTDKTPIVTRAEIEAKEKHEREFAEKFDEYCTRNAAKCSPTETCYYNQTRLNGHGGRYISGVITDVGPACVCGFATGPGGKVSEYGRAHTDGTGACVVCAAGPNGTQPFVQRPAGNPDGPGVKGFHNGEFACAFGPKKDAKTDHDAHVALV